MRDPSAERLTKLLQFWNTDENRAIALKGDLTEPGLGIAPGDVDRITNKVDHVFHLGAIYDLEADPAAQMRTNIEGTRNAILFAAAIGAKRFHHMSSIAAAGLYRRRVPRGHVRGGAIPGASIFRQQARSGKELCATSAGFPGEFTGPVLSLAIPMTGEMDKVDGPYYFFKLIQKMRKLLPSWMPSIGFEGGRINLVPVDFVVAALTYLAHVEGEDGNCFHLTDPHPHRVGDILNIFCRAAHAPEMASAHQRCASRFHSARAS